MNTALQSALRLIYPPRCTVCGLLVDSDFGLCGPCWRDTPFISGLCCETCGVPLLGDSHDEAEYCDDCLRIARPWKTGRAAVLYKDNGRKLVLALKHGDRHDVVRPAAIWMARAAQPLMSDDTLIVPIPLHWLRMLKRRYNQAALLARAVAKEMEKPCCPDVLVRRTATPSLGGLGFDARHAALQSSMHVHPSRKKLIEGRRIVLVDDVMTSGATFSVASQACFAAGAKEVCILALARATKDT